MVKGNFNEMDAPALNGEPKRAPKQAKVPPQPTVEADGLAEAQESNGAHAANAAQVAEETFAPTIDQVQAESAKRLDEVGKTQLPEKQENLQEGKSAPSPTNPAIDEAGMITSANFAEEWKIASVMASSGMVPEGFRNKPAAVLMAIQTAKSRGLNPLTAIQSMANIFGRTQAYGELPLAEVFASKKLSYFEEFWFDKDGKPIKEFDMKTEIFGAACICEAAEGPQGRITRIFTMDMAAKAKLSTDPKRSTWQHYPKRMLQMRARGHALKDSVPEITAGISMPDYDEHSNEVDLLPPSGAPSIADKLNQRVLEKKDGKPPVQN
jgi:hypothetical protein